jgi:hypothetical protein
LYFLGLRAFLALTSDKAHLLTFGQGLETLYLNSAEVNEEIRATVRGSDKAEAFAVVEPLYGTSLTIRHVQFPEMMQIEIAPPWTTTSELRL